MIDMNSHKGKNFLVAALFFLIAFYPILWLQFSFFKNMPGDIGDPRLFHYFLENVYQFLQNPSESLINTQFYSPFPGMLGLAENMYGSFPVYYIARKIFPDPETAFQVWYVIGYLANYTAAYIALRWLKLSNFASIMGALIFTFALPVSGQIGHSQLQYRFAVPIVFVAFTLFLKSKNWKYLILAAIFTVWQFLTGIYIGFFLGLFLVVIFSVYLIQSKFSKIESQNRFVLKEFRQSWSALSKKFKILYLIILVFCALGFALLFYPYLQASNLYHLKRSIYSIASMLPQPKSYIMASHSLIWSKLNLNMYAIGEHQMFFGIVPITLALIGAYFARKQKDFVSSMFGWSLFIVFILSLSVLGGWVSLWYIFAKLPLFSAMRSVTRICLVMLFPLAYFAALGVDQIKSKLNNKTQYFLVLIAALLIFEFSAIKLEMSSKTEWQTRVRNKSALMDTELKIHPKNSPIVFYAQNPNEPFYAEELDAMWVARSHNIATLNGLTGFILPTFSQYYFADCTEIPRRVVAYLEFLHEQNNETLYKEVINRIVPIGFHNCQQKWWDEIPKYKIKDINFQCKEQHGLMMSSLGIPLHSKKADLYLRALQTFDKIGIQQCAKKLVLDIES